MASKANVAAVMAALFAAGCRGEPNRNTSVTAVVAPATVPAVDAGDRTALAVVLDDPIFRDARTAYLRKEYVDALVAFDRIRPTDGEGIDVRCARDYLSGRLASLAANPDAAARFEKVGAECALYSYARLRAAQAHLRTNNYDAAEARAGEIGGEIALSEEAKAIVAEAAAGRGNKIAALPYWRETADTLLKGAKWADLNLRIASALLEGNAPDQASAREAFDRLTRVYIDSPKSFEVGNAAPQRSRARSILNEPRPSEEITADERARRAAAWLDASEETKAIAEANRVLGEKATPENASVRCRAAVTKANALLKSTPKPTTDVWSEAVALCEKEENFAQVLFLAAKSSAQQKRDPEALARFAKIEELFPLHRLADDARLKAATIHAQAGDTEKSLEMLGSLPDAYPEGDMRGESLFRAAFAHIKKNKWEEAVPLLNRINALYPDDRHWGTRARADYFLARAAEVLGRPTEAEEKYASIVARHPLAFYMLLAHARLSAKNPQRAASVWKEAPLKDSASAFQPAHFAEMDRAEFKRALRLLEVGEIDAAKREFAKSGATSDGAPSDLLYLVGAIYNRAGSFDIGHTFSRQKQSEFLSHYPEGAWRAAWEVAFPRAYESLVAEGSSVASIPRSLAWGIMREESTYVADAKSPSNAYGLMQLIVPTAKWMAQGTALPYDENSLKKPDISITFGTKLLGKLRVTHKHPALAIGAYNGGSGAVNRWVAQRTADDFDIFTESIPWDETRNYVKRVLASQAAYAYLYEPAALDEVLLLPISVIR